MPPSSSEPVQAETVAEHVHVYLAEPVQPETVAEPVQAKELGRGQRSKKALTRLADYVTRLLHNPPPSATPYPLDNYVSTTRSSPNYQAYVMAISSAVKPTSYK